MSFRSLCERSSPERRRCISSPFVRGHTLGDSGSGDSGGVRRGMVLGSGHVFEAPSDSNGKDSRRLVGNEGASMRDCHSDSKLM